MTYTRLPASFFARDTHIVARELLGTLLVRRWRGIEMIGRIVEVESYVGENDAACHAAKGRTPRTDVMFGPAGRAYVYFIYGMYHCLNVVTDAVNFPAAVLIRALEPIDGTLFMQRRRNALDVHKLTSGPGKLTQALAITRTLNGEDMTASQKLFAAKDDFHLPRTAIAASPRIGVAYAGADALLPWRYYVKDSSLCREINKPFAKFSVCKGLEGAKD